MADRDDDLDVGVTDQADAMMIIARRTWTDPCFPRRTICCSRRPSSSASRRAPYRLSWGSWSGSGSEWGSEWGSWSGSEWGSWSGSLMRQPTGTRRLKQTEKEKE